MTTNREITLGTVQIPVPPIPLGRVRKLPIVCNRIYKAFALGIMDDAVSDDILQVIVLGTGLPAAELDAMPATFEQLREAVDVITDVAGLKAKGGGQAVPEGEAQAPAVTLTAGGTTSTLTSSPAPAGPGTTSTDA